MRFKRNGVAPQFMVWLPRNFQPQAFPDPLGYVGDRALRFLCLLLLLQMAFVSDALAEPTLNNASVTDDASNQEGSKNETASFKEPASKAPGTSEKGVQEALEKSTKTPEIPESKGKQSESPSVAKTAQARIQGDLGLEVVFASGLNLCGPRGGANCNDILPGFMGRAALQYRFWHLGIGLNYRVGNYFPVGTGSEDLTMRTRHGIFEFLGFLPRYGSVEPFIGLGLGYGSVESRDARSNSEIAWRSLWESFSARFGVRGKPSKALTLGSSMIWELNGTILTHQGGERCVLFAGQGACRPSNELEANQTDYASTFGLEAAIGWSF